MTKKTLLTILSIGLIVSLSGAAASSVFADDEDYNNPLIQRLAETFGVSEDEVEAVFDAVWEEHHEEMHKKHQEKLQQAVDDGVITQEQLDAILDKHQQMWEERHQERQEHYEKMQSWYQQQGINQRALMEYVVGHHGEKFGMKKYHIKFHH